MAEYVKVATVDEIPVGSLKAVEINYDRIVIAHTADGFFAVADECTHDSAPISDGKLIRNEVICVRHGARFDVRTGEVTRAPALVPLDTYEVKVEGNEVYVLPA
jgi:3-phenylpropionate/trans-cinnamate dioxygenase ferredoxin subunit